MLVWLDLASSPGLPKLFCRSFGQPWMPTKLQCLHSGSDGSLTVHLSLSSGVSGLRLEKLPDLWFDYNDAFALVTQFYGGPLQRTADNTVPQS